jgi:hypothetical protein
MPIGVRQAAAQLFFATALAKATHRNTVFDPFSEATPYIIGYHGSILPQTSAAINCVSVSATGGTVAKDTTRRR